MRYDHERLITGLGRIKEKYPDDPNLKECGDVFRKGIASAGAKGSIDADFIRKYLSSHSGDLYTDLRKLLEDSLHKEVFTIVYCETFEGEYKIEADSFDDAVKKFRERISAGKGKRPTSLLRTECFQKGD